MNATARTRGGNNGGLPRRRLLSNEPVLHPVPPSAKTHHVLMSIPAQSSSTSTLCKYSKSFFVSAIFPTPSAPRAREAPATVSTSAMHLKYRVRSSVCGPPLQPPPAGPSSTHLGTLYQHMRPQVHRQSCRSSWNHRPRHAQTCNELDKTPICNLVVGPSKRCPNARKKTCATQVGKCLAAPLNLPKAISRISNRPVRSPPHHREDGQRMHNTRGEVEYGNIHASVEFGCSGVLCRASCGSPFEKCVISGPSEKMRPAKRRASLRRHVQIALLLRRRWSMHDAAPSPNRGSHAGGRASEHVGGKALCSVTCVERSDMAQQDQQGWLRRRETGDSS